jgi:tRNA G10  N-methylase Trm11
MVSYLLVFGRTPKLSFRELSTFFPNARLLTDEVAIVTSETSIDPIHFMQILGGTVKIAVSQLEIGTADTERLISLLTLQKKDIVIGISGYGVLPSKSIKEMLFDLKKELVARGYHVRFIEPRHGKVLTSVVVEKNDVEELIIVGTEKGYMVGKTVAVQPFESWGERDYERPHADPKAGMLPPKVARMIVNIAQGSPEDNVKANRRLLDPFCGMGTILAEALCRGWRVTGGDVSEEVARLAFENLTWILRHTEGVLGRIDGVFTSEAVHISQKLDDASIDAIVTEPYMGSTGVATRQDVSVQEIKNIIKGLEKLYIGCLRDWHAILKPGGLIIIALPKYLVQGRSYFVKKVVDMCENLGYTIETEPIDYGRDQAVVRRSFYILKKK